MTGPPELAGRLLEAGGDVGPREMTRGALSGALQNPAYRTAIFFNVRFVNQGRIINFAAVFV